MKTSIALLLSLFACVSFAEDDSLFQLMNYYEYSDKLMSAGQPLPEQFPSIAAAGIETVINLAPLDSPTAVADEAKIVEGLGMRYVFIPVDWEAPPVADVERFLAAMQANEGRRILVHCMANARASAFTYLYRVLRAGHDRTEAAATMVRIWDMNPGYELKIVPQWQTLIEDASATLATSGQDASSQPQ